MNLCYYLINMITNCIYSVNDRIYTENSYIALGHKYREYKTIYLYKDINDIKRFGTNILIDEHLQTYISDLESDDCLYQLITNENIHTKEFLSLYLPKNVSIMNAECVLKCERPNIVIVDSSMKDLIGMEISLSEIFCTFSEFNVGIRNFVTYKYVNFEIEITNELEYVMENSIENQITSIINYQTYKSNIATISEMNIMIKRLSHSYNRCLIEYTRKHICSKQCKQFLDRLRCDLILKICSDDFLSDILFKKQLDVRHMWSDIHSAKLNNHIKIYNTYNTYNTNEKIVHIPENEELDEQYMSYISYDTVSECCNDNKCLCVLIDSDTKDIPGKFIKCCTTVITNIDILRSHIIFINEYNQSDDSPGKIRSINIGIRGTGNHGLPIFINDDHWKNAIKFVEEFVSLSVSGCSFTFNKHMLSIYHMALFGIICDIDEKMISSQLVSTLLNLIITIKKINKHWSVDIDTDISYEKPNPIPKMVNYLIYDCSKVDTYFNNACIVSIQKIIYTFDGRRKNMFKFYAKNRSNLIDLATKNLPLIAKINKLCMMKHCIDELLNEFIIFGGLITPNMINKFKTSYSAIQDITYISLLYSTDKRSSNPLEKSLIDNLLLSSQYLV
jgi:hypothetical protein